MTAADIAVVTPDSVVADWAGLVERVAGSPFLEPGWVLSWHRAFGRGPLVVLTVRRDGRLVAALPVVWRFGAAHAPANWHTPEYGVLAEDPAAATALLAAMFGRRPRSISLRFVDASATAAVEAAAARHGYRVLSRVIERSPYIPVRTSFADYQVQVPAKQRNDLARRRRRLEEQGEVRLEIRTDVSPEALAEFVRLEESGWKAGDAVAEDTRARRFYTDVAAWAAQRGLLRIAFLRVGEQAIAADLAIETERRHYLLKTGYDPDYRRYGPGKLLRREMVEHAFTAGLDSYEFLGTDEPWKLEWTGHVRDRMAVQAFAPSLTGRFEHAVQAYGRPLAKAVVTASRRR